MFIRGMVIISCATWMRDHSDEIDELSRIEMRAFPKMRPNTVFEKLPTFLRSCWSELAL